MVGVIWLQQCKIGMNGEGTEKVFDGGKMVLGGSPAPDLI
jgi:hypothetical protein